MKRFCFCRKHKSWRAAMSLYDDLGVGASDTKTEGWSKNFKLLQSQLKVKKAALTQAKVGTCNTSTVHTCDTLWKMNRSVTGNILDYCYWGKSTNPKRQKTLMRWKKVTSQNKNWMNRMCMYSVVLLICVCRPSEWSRPLSWLQSLIWREEAPVMRDRSQTLLHMLPLDLRSVFSSEPAWSSVFVKSSSSEFLKCLECFKPLKFFSLDLIWLDLTRRYRVKNVSM